MRIALTRAIELTAFEVVMEIGRAEKRRDILAVLMKARELGSRITPEDVCTYLLIGRPVALGRTVVSRCQEYGLLDLDGRLTPLGEYGLEHERVFNPERGRYRVLCTQDPLVPQTLLSLKEVPEPYADEVVQRRKRAKGSGATSPPPEDQPLPGWISSLEGKTVTPVDSGEEIRVLKAELRCVKGTVEAEEKLSLLWALSPEDDPTLEVRGFARRVLDPPPVSYEEVFLDLLGERRPDWDPEVGVLRVGFEEMSDAERSSFRKDLHVEKSVVGRYGAFDATEIHDVPLGPRTRADAQRWASWTLDQSISTYLSRGDYDHLVRRVVGLFPEFPVSLPKREELASALRRGVEERGERLPRAYWFLLAPIDLDMPEVSA